MEVLKGMEKNRKAFINNLVTYVGFYLANGYTVDGRKMSFTALDYYSIFEENIGDVAMEVRSLVRSNNIAYQNYFLQFANNNGYAITKVEDAKKVMDEHNVFIINDKRIVPTEEDIQEILDLLDQYNIPKYEKVVYTALSRKAFGYQILQFVSQEEKTMSK